VCDSIAHAAWCAPAGDAKERLPLGNSPLPSAISSRTLPSLATRDSAELRRQAVSGKDVRKSPGGAFGALDLMLTGKKLTGHALGGAQGDAVSLLRESSDSVGVDCSQDMQHISTSMPRADEAAFDMAENEAQILSESWQGSPRSILGSKSTVEGGDDTISPPSSRFASANTSRERQCAWSPEARHITSASVDQMDSRAYDEDDEDNMVNQSLDTSVTSATYEHVERHTARSSAASARSSHSSSPTRVRPPLEVNAVRARLSASSPSKSEEAHLEIGASRHRGTIAARAMMGRKRVYGAVVIQRWMRLQLQRNAQRQRNDVKDLLRERRERKDDEQQVRRLEEDRLAASLRSEKEQSLKAALEQREHEVEQATQRLKRNMQAAMPRCAAPRSAASSASAAAALAASVTGSGASSAMPSPMRRPDDLDRAEDLSKPSAASSPSKSTRRQDSYSMASPASFKSTSETCTRPAVKVEEQSLMNALRASVERSADMLGLVRGSPIAGRSPRVVLNASTMSSAKYGVEDEGASSDDGNPFPAQHQPHSQSYHCSPHSHTSANEPAVASKVSAHAPHFSKAAPMSSPGGSPSYRSSGVLSPVATSDLLRRRAMQMPEVVNVASPHVSPVASPMMQTADRERAARQGNMDAAAKELQTSILSFLDSVEQDNSVVNASFSTDCGGAVGSFAVPPVSSSYSEATEHGRDVLALSQGPRRALALPEGDAVHGVKPPANCLASRPPLASSLHNSPSSHLCEQRVGSMGMQVGGSAGPSSGMPSMLSSPAASSSGRGNGAPVLAAQVYGEVKARMASLKVELEHKEKTITDLKEALRHQKADAAAQQQQHAENLNSQLSLQRQEYEAQVKRQLEFVDQLVNDKGALSAKCEELAAEFQLLQRRFQEQVKELEEKQTKELKKQRESMAVSEKIRRDTWMQEKSREIKEMTVKGLQPEIERLLSKHKKELQRMEEVNGLELKRQRDVRLLLRSPIHAL